ncbi:MAG: SulP family inorganic anion transporter [Gammaproteobacteria bacterium]|nr:SulP family inorganic anion transporter [Gammaproteobacteria bacterium]
MDWIGELKDPQVLKADLIAGITVALVLVPQSMAYAQLAGLPPYIGLYASFVPVMLAAFMGSSRQLGTGPVAVVSLMTAAALQPLVATGSEGYLVYAAVLALMVGVFQLALGLFRLGVLVDFLSHPVVVGFTNGAAIIIATSQLSKLFGVKVESAEHHYETVWRVLVEASQHTHMPTLIMGLCALGMMFAMRKFMPKLPNVLIAVVVTTVAAYAMGFAEMGGKVVGDVPKGLPSVKVPTFSLDVILQLSSAAVTIALIAFMEAVAIAKAMAASTRQRLDTNQELVGQGLGNIAAGFFQSYPVSGSFSRSAVNFSAGALTGFSSIVTGLVVAITLLFLTPLLYHLPQATLAAIIVMAVINLVKIEPIKHAMKVQKHDGMVAIITFALTLIVAPHLEKSIIVGVMLSLGLFLYRSMRPRFSELSVHPDGTLRDADVHDLERCETMSVLRFDGSLYFANAGYFETKVLANIAGKPKLKYVIIDAEGINQIDATGEEMLHVLSHRMKSAGVQLMFARAKKQIIDIFRATHFVEHLGEQHFFRTRTDAIHFARANIGEDATASPLLRGEMATASA